MRPSWTVRRTRRPLSASRSARPPQCLTTREPAAADPDAPSARGQSGRRGPAAMVNRSRAREGAFWSLPRLLREPRPTRRAAYEFHLSHAPEGRLTWSPQCLRSSKWIAALPCAAILSPGIQSRYARCPVHNLNVITLVYVCNRMWHTGFRILLAHDECSTACLLSLWPSWPGRNSDLLTSSPTAVRPWLGRRPPAGPLGSRTAQPIDFSRAGILLAAREPS